MGGAEAIELGKLRPRSRCSSSTRVCSHQVVHKAALQVDEKGLEAAAPTRVSLSAAPGPLTLRFNQPFIIMIFDDFTWSSLFLGKVVNPT